MFSVTIGKNLYTYYDEDKDDAWYRSDGKNTKAYSIKKGSLVWCFLNKIANQNLQFSDKVEALRNEHQSHLESYQDTISAQAQHHNLDYQKQYLEICKLKQHVALLEREKQEMIVHGLEKKLQK